MFVGLHNEYQIQYKSPDVHEVLLQQLLLRLPLLPTALHLHRVCVMRLQRKVLALRQARTQRSGCWLHFHLLVILGGGEVAERDAVGLYDEVEADLLPAVLYDIPAEEQQGEVVDGEHDEEHVAVQHHLAPHEVNAPEVLHDRHQHHHDQQVLHGLHEGLVHQVQRPHHAGHVEPQGAQQLECAGGEVGLEVGVGAVGVEEEERDVEDVHGGAHGGEDVAGSVREGDLGEDQRVGREEDDRLEELGAAGSLGTHVQDEQEGHVADQELSARVELGVTHQLDCYRHGYLLSDWLFGLLFLLRLLLLFWCLLFSAVIGNSCIGCIGDIVCIGCIGFLREIALSRIEHSAGIDLVGMNEFVDPDEVADFRQNMHLPHVNKRLVVEQHLISISPRLLVQHLPVYLIVPRRVYLDPGDLLVEVEAAAAQQGTQFCQFVLVQLHEVLQLSVQRVDLLDGDGLVGLALALAAVLAADLFGECCGVVLEGADDEGRGQHLQEEHDEQQPQGYFEVRADELPVGGEVCSYGPGQQLHLHKG